MVKNILLIGLVGGLMFCFKTNVHANLVRFKQQVQHTQEPTTIAEWKDYITSHYDHLTKDFSDVGDGTHVFDKSYTKWLPQDLKTLKDNAPKAFDFLLQVASPEHFHGESPDNPKAGCNVLNCLLPDYYKTHGGVAAFSKDILSTSGH